MSNYNSERGTIKLPAAAVTQVKRAVRETNNAEHERVYNQATAFWRGLKSKPKDRRVLWQKLDAWRDEQERTSYRATSFGLREYHDPVDGVSETVSRAMYRNGQKPCAPRREDVRPKKATNKDAVFHADDFAISFSGREVTWSVGENNHAVERAAEHPLAVTFFRALRNVKWTRGTGGVIKYQDEYQHDAFAGPTVSHRFGPLGERAGLYA